MSKRYQYKEQVDAVICAIFKANHVRAGFGEEAFWEAVDRVAKKNKTALRRLRSLARKWEFLPYKN